MHRILQTLALTLPLVGLPAQAPRSLDPGPKNLDAWLKFIRPSSAESSYEQIGWRNKFWPAVQEAKRLGRPVLLWTMNGHPLGCT